MSRKKLALIISLTVAVSAIAAGIVYAQEATPFAFDDQEPGSTARAFSLFVGDGPFLGVGTEDITKENMARYGMREVRGVGITEVIKGSPAEKAGLRKDDVLLRFDGESITSVRKLMRLVSESSADQSVRLTISRGGSEQEVVATLARHEGSQNVFGGVLPSAIFRGRAPGGRIFDPGQIQINPGEATLVFALGNRRIGVSTQTLTKQLADYFGVKDGGVLVTSVNDNSPASKAGLKAGDVITAIDGEKVSSPGDIVRALSRKETGDVSLTIVRDHATRTVTVTPEKNEQPSLIRPGTISTRRVVIPSIEIPSVPEMNIRIPRIVVPATPPIEVTVPKVAPPVVKTRTVII